MQHVKISADSTCDLSDTLIRQYDIQIIPLYIIMDKQSYADGLEIQPDDIFAHVSAGGETCTTSAVNVADYLTLFRQLRSEYPAVIHFTISSDMSSCYRNACIAAAEFDHVYVIDSRSLSTGIGHLVLDAAMLAADGASAEEIIAMLEAKKEKLQVSFVINTLHYLHKGGRCSALTALGANLLQLKPCIEVRNGSMGVGRKYRGKFEQVILQYTKEQFANPERIDTKRLMITDSGVAPELRQQVEEAALACVPFETVLHTRAGCTVSAHCGPQCLGVLFYQK